MGFSASDVVPFTQARANLTELADQAKAGAEKIFTKNGESYVALTDAKRGLADITAGSTFEADAAIVQLQKRRASATKAGSRRHAAATTTAGTVAKKRG